MQAAAVVLAAGRSTRLGQPKQLLDLGEAPLIRRTVASVAAARSVGEVVVVTGAWAAEVEKALEGLSCRIVHNPAYAEGMSTSLRCGIAALGPEVPAAVICLGDQPLVTPAIIEQLVGALGEPGKSIAQPLYGEQRGNPVAFARRHFAGLMQATGDAGGRGVIKENPDEVVLVRVGDEQAALDVDTWADYEEVRRRGSWGG